MENGKTTSSFLAITIFVVAFLFSANFAFAAKTKISDQEAERVKTALSIVKTASNIGGIFVDGGNLKTALNTVIKGGETATDVTYGLLVLSAINEMEFMDMVLSQDYKDKERAYFEQVLDERTNLISHWKGIGFDIQKAVSGNITGPMGALSLNTFGMTDKVILILTEFEVLKKSEQYDGLYYYFDFRRGGDSHKEAWEMIEIEMGFAAKSVGFHRGNQRKENTQKLESQFLALYEKWGPYATPYGISKKYKEQLASELQTTLASAIKENTGVAPLYVEERSVWDKLTAQLASIKNALANIVSQVRNPFSAGPIVELPVEVSTEDSPPIISTMTEPQPEAQPEPQPEIQPELQPEIMEVGHQLFETLATTTEPETEKAEIIEVQPPLESTSEKTYEVEPLKIEFCRREDGGAARQYRVLINEVAWMGDLESFNNEWIELKNIFGIPINLSGWQLQDKDQQIKVIFSENDAIPAQEYFLLERSKNYTGALNNTNEAIYLFDNNCQLEDEVLANPDWPEGDNLSKKTMQRFDVLYWYAGTATAGAENSSPPAALTHPSAPAPTPAPPPPQEETISGSVVINEIAWTGTKANSADEWLELYNNTASAVNLTGWKIKKGGSDWITISTSTISANSYYLLERTDNNTISNITADQIYTGALSNTGETLELRDSGDNLIDSVNFSSGWPAGVASPNYISMERIISTSTAVSANWAGNNRITRNGLDANNNSINGTPKAQNSVSKSSTEINNSILFDEDITLTRLGNPYIINSGTVEVQTGVTLTIESGTTVKFNSGTKMLIHGNLLAQGTSGNKIIFTSNTDSDPENNGGYYIYFDTSGSSSVLDNVIVRYGGHYINAFAGYRAALTIENASSTISNSLFENNFFVGLYLMNSTSTIKSTIFRDNKVKYSDLGTGSYSRGLSLYNSTPVLQNDYFGRNYHGVYVEGSCPDLSSATFGTGDNANTSDVTPESCAP